MGFALAEISFALAEMGFALAEMGFALAEISFALAEMNFDPTETNLYQKTTIYSYKNMNLLQIKTNSASEKPVLHRQHEYLIYRNQKQLVEKEFPELKIRILAPRILFINTPPAVYNDKWSKKTPYSYLMTSTGQFSAASLISSSYSLKFTPSFTSANSGISNTSGAVASHTPQEIHPSSIQTFVIAIRLTSVFESFRFH
jgi:hypothetical protein